MYYERRPAGDLSMGSSFVCWDYKKTLPSPRRVDEVTCGIINTSSLGSKRVYIPTSRHPQARSLLAHYFQRLPTVKISNNPFLTTLRTPTHQTLVHTPRSSPRLLCKLAGQLMANIESWLRPCGRASEFFLTHGQELRMSCLGSEIAAGGNESLEWGARICDSLEENGDKMRACDSKGQFDNKNSPPAPTHIISDTLGSL